MTREDIECIIKWFSHIEQLATDGKTANGFQMPTDRLLATIKVVAKDSREYVEKFFNESIPNDLEEAAYNHILRVADAAGHPGWDWTAQDIAESFIAGAKWQAEHSPLPEDTVLFNKGVEEGKRLMMEEAVEGRVYDFRRIKEIGYSSAKIEFDKIPELDDGDKVRVIVLPKRTRNDRRRRHHHNPSWKGIDPRAIR